MALNIDEILALLDEWLKAEDDTIAQTNKISAGTGNETIKVFMDIIRTDSAKHKRIQQFMKDSLTKASPALSFDEIATISDMVNEHLKLEQATVDMGQQLFEKMKLPILKDLADYLLADERLHVNLLNAMINFKGHAEKNT